MEIKIYQGASEIGGVITGVSCGAARILIDFGRPLTGPAASGGRDQVRIDEPYDALIFTHYHRDHTDLIEYVAENVPLYMGKTAKELFLAAQRHKDPDSPAVKRIEGIIPYEDGVPFEAAGMRITPILTDHSGLRQLYGCSSKAMADGCCIREISAFTGLKGNLVLPSLSPLTGTVDAMITEGTNLSFKAPVTVSEYHLADASGLLMQRFPYVFVQCGALDIDRLAVFHMASQGRRFCCDPYQMSLLEIVRRSGSAGSCLAYGFDRARVWMDGGKEPDTEPFAWPSGTAALSGRS